MSNNNQLTFDLGAGDSSPLTFELDLNQNQNMIGAPDPVMPSEEEKKKRAEDWLRGIGQNPIGSLGNVIAPDYTAPLSPVGDFAARSVLSATKKVSATMDTLRLMEESARAGDLSLMPNANSFDYLKNNPALSAIPNSGILGVADIAGDTLMKMTATGLSKLPVLDGETHSILGDLTFATDQTVDALKKNFEAEHGGMSEGMKNLGKAQDWSQVRDAFKEDKWGILRDMGSEAAGQIIALATTRKLPGGIAGQITGAGAISFGLNFGTNVQDSLAQGKKVNEALDDGLTKTYGDVLGDTLGLGLSGIKYAKKKIYDRMWQFGADSIGSTLLMQQSRAAVNEDMSFGDLVANFGSNVFFSTPAEIFSAIKEHKYDSIKDALTQDSYKGNTAPAQVAIMGAFLDAQAARNQNGLDLEEATLAMQSDPALNPPTIDEINTARTNDSNNLPPARVDNPLTAEDQFLRNAPGETMSLEVASRLFNTLGAEITHGPGGGLLQQPKRLSDEVFQKGKAILAWSSRETEMMRAALFDHDVGSPEMQLVAQREKLEAQIEKDVHSTTEAFIKQLMPEAAVIVTDRIIDTPQYTAEGERINSKAGGMVKYLPPAADGTPRFILSLDKSAFFKQDDKIRQEDGSPSLVYDKTRILNVLTHEFGHGFVENKLKGFSNQALAGIRTAYDSVMQAIEHLPLNEAVQVLYPKGLIPGLLAQIKPEMMSFPISQLKKTGSLKEMLSFREFLANQFAKAVLEDDKAMSVLPELQPFIQEMRNRTDKITESLGSSFPNAKKAITSAFIENLLHTTTAQEERSMKKLENVKEYHYPETDNSAWFHLKQGQDFFNIDTKSIEDAVKNPNIAPQDRRALQRTINALEINSTKSKEINHAALAVTFDKYLQFESDVQKKWDSLNPITKIVQKFLKNDPRTPELIAKAAQSGRIAAIAANLFQMTELNPNVKEFGDYAKEHDAGVSERNQELHQAEQLIQTLQNKPRAQLEALDAFMIDLTSGIFEDKHKKAMQLMKQKFGEMDSKQMAQAAKNMVMRDYGLGPESSKDISRIERYFRGKIHKLEALELSQVMEKWESGRMNSDQMKKTTANIKRRYTMVKSRAYYPLMRFGREAVIVRAVNDFTDSSGESFKAGETVYRKHYESKSEADNALEGFRDTLKNDPNVAVVRDTLSKQKTQTPELPYALFEGLQERLIEEGAEPSIIREVQDFVREQARDNSFAKRLMQRKGVAGAGGDILRTIRRYAESYGAFYSGLAHTSKMGEAISKLSRDIDSRVRNANDLENNDDIAKRAGLKAIRDYMQEHFDYIKSPANEFEGLKALGFFWHLGFDVTSAVVNTTSIPMFVYPHLARFVDDKTAVSLISKSITDITQGTKNNKSRITPMEQNVLSALEKDGTLTQNLSLEFAALALDKSSRFKLANKLKEFAHSALHSSAGMFQATEHFSRQVTALAAIRAAKERGVNTEKELQAFAKHTVRSTLFEYSRGNRAWLTRNWRSVLFLFQQFTHNGVYFMSRGNGASMRYLALMFAAAGAQGIPGGEDVMDLIDVLGNTLSKEKVDVRKGLREIAEGFGIDSDAVMHGGSRYGFGIPDLLSSVSGIDVPDVDLSSRMTAGRLIPFGVMQTANKLSSGGDVRDGASETLQNVSGAVGSIAWNALNALDGIRKDPSEWKNYEGMLPRALKQVSAGARWLVQGEETDSQGVPIVEFNNRDSHDILSASGKMLGLNPTEVSKKQELGFMQYQHYQYWVSQRSGLLEQYRGFAMQELSGPAHPQGDETRRIMESIIDFNQEAPEGFQINVKTLKSSIRQGLLREALKKQGYISGTVQSSSFKEYEDLFFRKPSTEPQIMIYEQ